MRCATRTGAAIPGYFNIWHWILPQLTPAERGGKRASPKPEAILKYANHPIAMLGGLWQKELEERAKSGEDPRPPVFILVCKNTAIAKVIYEWLAEDRPPTGIPPAKIEGFRNRDGCNYTIRVDSKVVHETDDLEGSKGDEVALDASDPGHGGQDAVAQGPAGPRRFIPRASRNWRRSWIGRSRRPAATCAASSAWAC